mmetsp:Transcript_22325/g.71433  ORF Transcript_22325/g.71433 Transcript_22325/m.71433 type:complete len:286 (-) Transcript_22325:26-883(-)
MRAASLGGSSRCALDASYAHSFLHAASSRGVATPGGKCPCATAAAARSGAYSASRSRDALRAAAAFSSVSCIIALAWLPEMRVSHASYSRSSPSSPAAHEVSAAWYAFRVADSSAAETRAPSASAPTSAAAVRETYSVQSGPALGSAPTASSSSSSAGTSCARAALRSSCATLCSRTNLRKRCQRGSCGRRRRQSSKTASACSTSDAASSASAQPIHAALASGIAVTAASNTGRKSAGGWRAASARRMRHASVSSGSARMRSDIRSATGERSQRSAEGGRTVIAE